MSHGGFDTHSAQLNQHATLLTTLGEAVGAFLQDIDRQGRAQDVLVMTFSEFGRRISENASRGTDHGAAAPLFLLGRPVAGGLTGPAPTLADDPTADVPFAIDFRRVYASVIREWLGADPVPVVGEGFAPLGILK